MSIKLVVDSEDNYIDEPDIFYLPGPHVAGLKCVRPNQFSEASIINTDVDYLTSYALSNLYTSLQPGAKVSIVISQPVAVMQEYDAKQVEANARLAGFEDISVSETTFVEPKSGKELTTQQLDLVKTENEDSGTKVKTTKQTVVTTTTTKTESRRRK